MDKYKLLTAILIIGFIACFTFLYFHYSIPPKPVIEHINNSFFGGGGFGSHGASR